MNKPGLFESHPDDHLLSPEATGLQRLVVAIAVIVPFLALVAAMVLLWDRGVDWLHLGLMLVMYVLTVTGLVVGFHRYFTHRAFETTRPVQIMLAIMGSMGVEGPLLKWVAVHRRHHQHSDSEDDPHSPHGHGAGVSGVLRGMLHAHIGWLFKSHKPGLARYVKDLLRDQPLRQISSLFPLWVLLGLLIPAVAGGLITLTWTGALLGFLWGGLVRIFLVHHVSWSVNSVCHLWGARPYRSHDESRNSFVLGVLALGDGWHNNHHAFPTSARHGLHWWQFDFSYVVIRGLELVGLAWNVRRPTPEALAAKAAAPTGEQLDVPPIGDRERA